MKYNWVPASTPGMRPVEPVWLDLNQCGTRTMSLPAGPSERSYTWTVNRPAASSAPVGTSTTAASTSSTRNATDRAAHLQLGGPLRR